MSRGLVTRAVFAPLVIAIATTAVPPADLSSRTTAFLTETLPATLANLDGATLLEAVDREFARSTADITGFYTELNRRAVEGASDAVRLQKMASARVSAATDFISSSTDATLAKFDATLTKLDSWMTSMSLTVIAALPGASSDTHSPISKHSPVGKRQVSETTTVLASVPAGLSPFFPFAIRSDTDKTEDKTPPEKTAPVESAPQASVVAPEPVAPPRTHAEPTKPDVKVVTAPTPEKPVSAIPVILAVSAPAQHEAKEVPPAQPEVKAGTPAPVDVTVVVPVDVKVVASAPVDVKVATPAPTEKPVPVNPTVTAIPNAVGTPAPEEKPAQTNAPVIIVTNAIPAPAEEFAPDSPTMTVVANAVSTPAALPPAAADVKAVDVNTVREDQPEQKQLFASLGEQAAAIEPQPVPAAPPAAEEAKAEPAAKPASDEADTDDINQSSVEIPTAGISRMPTSSPLKLRPLTRGDIPSLEKFASLTSKVQGDSGNLPPEQQRVAYDAPITLDEPTSIGRRKWVDEANKYQGLGSPEALLEALRHMGASAKTLGLPGSLWCADFMNLVLRKTGLKATGSRAARSYLQYGTKIDEPRVGAIAIFQRGKNSGHIGIVRGTDGNGNPIIVSGNHGNKVAESVYPKSRVLAYVVPR